MTELTAPPALTWIPRLSDASARTTIPAPPTSGAAAADGNDFAGAGAGTGAGADCRAVAGAGAGAGAGDDSAPASVPAAAVVVGEKSCGACASDASSAAPLWLVVCAVAFCSCDIAAE